MIADNLEFYAKDLELVAEYPNNKLYKAKNVRINEGYEFDVTNFLKLNEDKYDEILKVIGREACIDYFDIQECSQGDCDYC